MVTAEFHKPDLRLPTPRLPGRRNVGSVAGAVAATARSLSPAELAYYAGLAGLAALELLEWPVALAVGAGTALAGARHGGEPSLNDTAAAAEAGPPGAETGDQR